MQQEFVRFTDEQELFEKMELAVISFNAFVLKHSVPPEENRYVSFDEL